MYIDKTGDDICPLGIDSVLSFKALYFIVKTDSSLAEIAIVENFCVVNFHMQFLLSLFISYKYDSIYIAVLQYNLFHFSILFFAVPCYWLAL